MTLPATKESMDQDRKWYLQARVEKHEDETQHWSVGDEGQIYLSVKTIRGDIPVHAIMGGGDVSHGGLFFIPSEGTEVGIGFDDGEFEGDAFVLAVFGAAPAAVQPGKLLIISPMTEIRNEDGAALALPTLADFNALKSTVAALVSLYNGHTHVLTVGTSSPPVPSASAPTNPSGTQAFKTR